MTDRNRLRMYGRWPAISCSGSIVKRKLWIHSFSGRFRSSRNRSSIESPNRGLIRLIPRASALFSRHRIRTEERVLLKQLHRCWKDQMVGKEKSASQNGQRLSPPTLFPVAFCWIELSPLNILNLNFQVLPFHLNGVRLGSSRRICLRRADTLFDCFRQD